MGGDTVVSVGFDLAGTPTGGPSQVAQEIAAAEFVNMSSFEERPGRIMRGAPSSMRGFSWVSCTSSW